MDMSLLGGILGNTSNESEIEIERLKNLGSTTENKKVAAFILTSKSIPTRKDCKYIFENGIIVENYNVLDSKGQFLDSKNEYAGVELSAIQLENIRCIEANIPNILKSLKIKYPLFIQDKFDNDSQLIKYIKLFKNQYELEKNITRENIKVFFPNSNNFTSENYHDGIYIIRGNLAVSIYLHLCELVDNNQFLKINIQRLEKDRQLLGVKFNRIPGKYYKDLNGLINSDINNIILYSSSLSIIDKFPIIGNEKFNIVSKKNASEKKKLPKHQEIARVNLHNEINSEDFIREFREVKIKHKDSKRLPKTEKNRLEFLELQAKYQAMQDKKKRLRQLNFIKGTSLIKNVSSPIDKNISPSPLIRINNNNTNTTKALPPKLNFIKSEYLRFKVDATNENLVKNKLFRLMLHQNGNIYLLIYSSGNLDKIITNFPIAFISNYQYENKFKVEYTPTNEYCNIPGMGKQIMILINKPECKEYLHLAYTIACSRENLPTKKLGKNARKKHAKRIEKYQQIYGTDIPKHLM